MLMSDSWLVSVLYLIFGELFLFKGMSVEFSMLVFRNEYVALVQGSKMSVGSHSRNLILAQDCYRISYLAAYM